jgi:hypothetical protein
MGIKLTNNANATLATGINSSATSITLTSGQGARFPTLGAGDFFYATLIDTSNNLEIVKCTARSTDVLTVVRAQESTTARAYNTGDRIEIRLTAQTFIDAVNEIGPTQVSDEANSSTGYFALPSGTTAQRPGSPTGSMIRKNTSTGYVEYYDPSTSSWVGIGQFNATGGTETTYSSGGTDYKVHTFTSSGTFQVTSGAKTVDVLIVAGGGAGGGGTAGGGGGGGVIAQSLVLPTGTYPIVIGAGASAMAAYVNNTGYNGGNSTGLGLTAIGGGAGANNGDSGSGGFAAKSGGSGGGGGYYTGGYLTQTTGASGTSGQGNKGGDANGVYNGNATGGAGGGGAGGVGGNGYGSNGGIGATSSIRTGSTVYYGGGGGGGGEINASSGGLGGGGPGVGGGLGSDANNGVVNTGGGGGGGYAYSTGRGGAGGSGIVVIRYTV